MKSIRIGNDIRIEWPIVLSGDVEKLQDLDLTVEVRPSAKIIDTHNYADETPDEDKDKRPVFIKTETTVMMNGGITCRPDIGDGKEHCRPRPCPPHPHRPVPPAPARLPYHIEDNTLIAMWTADRQFATGDYDIILYAHKNEGGQAVCDQYRFVRLVSHTAQADAPDDSGIEAVIAMQPVTLELSGLSAYEVAVINGFQGTEEEWLASLKKPAEDAAEELKQEIEQFKEDTKEELQADIDNLNANTGMDEYPAFSESTVYNAGNVVNYNGKLYKFMRAHAAGAWTGTDAEETDVIKAHIVQELGDDENAVMSQKATTDKLTEVESKCKQKKFWKNREVSILGNHAVFYDDGVVRKIEGYWVTEAIDVSGIYSLRTSEQNLGVGFWKSTNLNSESFLGFFETIDKVPAEALIAVICGSGSGKASIIVETQSATTETIMESKVYLSQAPSTWPFGDMVSDATFDSVAVYNPTNATQLIIEESVETQNLEGYMLYFTSDLSSATVAEKSYFTNIHRADGKIVIDTKGQSCILLVFTKVEPLGVDYHNIKYSFVGQMKGVDKTLSFAKDRGLDTHGTIVNIPGFSITENIAVENVKRLAIMNASNFADMYVGFWNTEEQKAESFIEYYTFTDALANRNGYIIFDVPSDAVSCNITYTSSEHEVIVRGDFFDKVTREVDVKVLIDYTTSGRYSDYGEIFIYDRTHDSVVVNVKGVERILLSINLSNLLGYCLYNGEPSKDTIMVKEFIQWQNGMKSLLIPIDCEYVVFVFKKGNNEFYNLSVLAEERKNYSGIYVYPFRSVIGKTEYLYKESLFTGLNPNCNYEVRSSVNSKKPNNYSGKALSYEVESISDNLVFKVFNENDEMCAIKQVSVTAKEMPAEKLASKSKLNVFFMGDSLLNFNSCIIGSEFVRMLNTSDGESTKEDAIALAALNLCKGKIETFGEDVGENGVRYQTIKNLTNLMTKKRTSARPNWEQNPFYNYESTEADEIGADGFNKRVDFKWYFEKNMGAGQYPNLIYITMGPNDVEATYHWEYGFAETQARNIVTMCRKIKTACDEIAGGESGVVIKFLTHQTYPLNTMYNYNFPIERQRNLWKYMYDAYYKAFKAEGISDWVELVDCASRFDWRIGYTTQEVSYNPRYTKSNDNTFISETCHMNRIGAYNYADCLINDFIADERFD